MAQTYYFQDAVAVAARSIPPPVVQATQAAVCNLALNEIWKAYTWREKLATLPVIQICPQQQDYGPPQVAVPADFIGLHQAWIVDLSSGQNNANATYPLNVRPQLDVTHVQQMPTVIGYIPDRRAFRLYPRPPGSMVPPYWIVEGVYTKRPTKVTAATIGSTLLPFDDLYFDVWVTALQWAFGKMGNDPQAEQIEVVNGESRVGGMKARMIAAVDAMAANEGYERGSPLIAPRESLIVDSGGGYPLGVFGY